MINKACIVVIFLTFACSCKQPLEKAEQNHIPSKPFSSSEEAVNIIVASEEFELRHHEIFQKDLERKSVEYYNNLVETFLDRETGFFRLFSELWDKPFKSEDEIKLLWKLKVDRYFRTTAYLTHIRNEVNIYTDGLNNQRNQGVSKKIDANILSDIKLPLVNANSFTSNNDTVENIINHINKEIIDQLADAVLGFTIEILLAILGLFGLYKGIKIHWSISALVFVILGAVFMWRSHLRQNDIRDILKAECNKVLINTRFDYLHLLNTNTTDYYSKLKTQNYENSK